MLFGNLSKKRLGLKYNVLCFQGKMTCDEVFSFFLKQRENPLEQRDIKKTHIPRAECAFSIGFQFSFYDLQ